MNVLLEHEEDAESLSPVSFHEERTTTKKSVPKKQQTKTTNR